MIKKNFFPPEFRLLSLLELKHDFLRPSLRWYMSITLFQFLHEVIMVGFSGVGGWDALSWSSACLVYIELQVGFPAPYKPLCQLILTIPALGNRSKRSRIQNLLPLCTECEASPEYMRF